MTLRTTPTIAICLVAGIAAGIALARPGDEATPQVAASPTPIATAVPATVDEPSTADEAVSDPYSGLADAAEANQDTAAAPVVNTPTAAVTIEGFAFTGAGTVAPGATIEVTNLDDAPHTLTADDGSFDTGNLAANQAGTITAPSAPGTYSYFCAIHPSMTSSITVG